MRNPVYKGEFYAHRYMYVKVPATNQRLNEPTRLSVKKVERPESEWIKVEVPAIVSTELWEMANRMLAKNSQTGRRNAKEPYLLTGFLKCASCGYAYTGQHKVVRKHGKEYLVRSYRDAGSRAMQGVFRDLQCSQSQIACARLDNAVWKVVSSALLQPQVLLDEIDCGFSSGSNAELQSEIGLLEEKIRDTETEEDDLYRAYRARVFDEHEYRERRSAVKDRRLKLKREYADLRGRIVTREQMERNKRQILEQARRLADQGIAVDAPFEVKKTILKLVVDRINLNVDEGWFEIEGAIPGRFGFDDSIECIPMDTGSSPQSAYSGHNRPSTLKFEVRLYVSPGYNRIEPSGKSRSCRMRA